LAGSEVFESDAADTVAHGSTSIAAPTTHAARARRGRRRTALTAMPGRPEPGVAAALVLPTFPACPPIEKSAYPI
jgi:hypothetical protein